MNTTHFLAVLLVVFVVKFVECAFDEKDFEVKRKEKNVFVLFVKDIQFGEFNHFFLQVKELYDKDKNSSIKYEKVDCVDHANFCNLHNITNEQLLQLKYFAFDNTDNKKMIDFIQARIDETLKTHAAEEAAKTQLMNGKSFVKFYSTDCPTCKAMANDWVELEKRFVNNVNAKIVSINCLETRMVCKKFKILHYPTLIFIDNGKANETYSKEKNLKGFVDFLDEKLKVEEAPKSEAVNHVLYLTPETFNQSVSKDIVFVRFTLQGCSHCIILDEDWKEAAEMVSTVDGVTLAEMECKDCYSFCLTQRAKGFPTMNVYKDGVMVNHDYHEVMTAQGFYDCAMAYHFGGKHLDDWVALQKELKRIRKAEKKAYAAAVAAGNITATTEADH